MPSPEHPTDEPNKEELYFKAARYEQESDAVQIYSKVQILVFMNNCDLSAYRLKLNEVSHVAILGKKPDQDLEIQIDELLATGKPTNVPENILSRLRERHMQAKDLGPWVEGHYRPGRPLF